MPSEGYVKWEPTTTRAGLQPPSGALYNGAYAAANAHDHNGRPHAELHEPQPARSRAVEADELCALDAVVGELECSVRALRESMMSAISAPVRSAVAQASSEPHGRPHLPSAIGEYEPRLDEVAQGDSALAVDP